MTALSRFRLFGRASGPPPYPAPAYGTPPPAGSGATGRPAPPHPAEAWPSVPADDPPTDPYGFPPIAAGPASAYAESAYAPAGYDAGAYAPSAYAPSDYAQPPAAAPLAGSPTVAPSEQAAPATSAPAAPGPTTAGESRSPGTPDPAEASSLAGAFAVDYLSWDEDDPARRGRVLLDYLPTPGSDPARLGWSGRGRQRAEFALPGLVRPDGEGRVLVDVRVRVTPYRSVGEHGPSNEPEPDVAGIPAVAPAPTGRGWRSLASYWIRISVPVAFEGGRLVVDAGEETLGEEPAPVAPVPDPVDDHSLADDDPLTAPPASPGGAW